MGFVTRLQSYSKMRNGDDLAMVNITSSDCFSG